MMRDITGKEALEELAPWMEGATPFEDRDMMRYEYGGGRIFITRNAHRKLVADLYHEMDREYFFRCSPDRLRAIATDFADLEKEVQKLREVLGWYGEQARLVRLIHSEGETGRAALAEDGGKRAREAIEIGGAR